MRHDRSFARLLNLDTKNIPPTLGFLVKDIQTLKGELAKLERLQQELPGQIAEKMRAIAAVEFAASRHPAKPDLTQLKGVQRHAAREGGYAALTKNILRVMRVAGKELASVEITDKIVELNGTPLDHPELLKLRKKVLRHMNYLRDRGHVICTNQGKTGGRTHAFWAFS